MSMKYNHEKLIQEMEKDKLTIKQIAFKYGYNPHNLESSLSYYKRNKKVKNSKIDVTEIKNELSDNSFDVILPNDLKVKFSFKNDSELIDLLKVIKNV